MNRRTMLLAIALILALGTGLLLFSYMSSLNRTAQTSPPRNVLIAVQPIPARGRITAELVRVEQRQADAVEPDALAAPADAVGALTLIDIPAGATITASKITRAEVSALPVELHPGMRALTIPIDRVKGVAGLVQAGDRVDVIAAPPRGEHSQPRAYTFLRDVRVLAVGTRLETTSATPSPDDAAAMTATLEVTPQQADELTAADLNTSLRLALRSPREPANSEPVEAMLFPIETAVTAPAPVAVQPAAPAPAARSLHPNVVVIDGDTVEH